MPVVLSSDFGLLSGLVVASPPLEQCESFVANTVSGTQPKHSYPRSVSSSSSTKESLQSGVYMQRYTKIDNLDTGLDDTKDSRSWWPVTFGARCVALFSDGKCAYSAISPSGASSVEVGGKWEVINGLVVLFGTAMCQNLSRS